MISRFFPRVIHDWSRSRDTPACTVHKNRTESDTNILVCQIKLFEYTSHITVVINYGTNLNSKVDHLNLFIKILFKLILTVGSKLPIRIVHLIWLDIIIYLICCRLLWFVCSVLLTRPSYLTLNSAERRSVDRKLWRTKIDRVRTDLKDALRIPACMVSGRVNASMFGSYGTGIIRTDISAND